jgi:hypothetical protein
MRASRNCCASTARWCFSGVPPTPGPTLRPFRASAAVSPLSGRSVVGIVCRHGARPTVATVGAGSIGSRTSGADLQPFHRGVHNSRSDRSSDADGQLRLRSRWFRYGAPCCRHPALCLLRLRRPLHGRSWRNRIDLNGRGQSLHQRHPRGNVVDGDLDRDTLSEAYPGEPLAETSVALQVGQTHCGCSCALRLMKD